MPVYFMQSPEGGPVKIGASEDVERRRGELEAYYGCALAVLATMAGGRPEERAIHRRFRHLRLGTTEQFRPEADLMAYIGRPLLVGANPEAVEAMLPAGQVTVFVLRGTPEFKAWMDGLAAHLGSPVTVMTERAMRELAKKSGYPPPPTRVP